MNKTQLFSLPENTHIHMIGIGGISMSALAHILCYLGCSVSGSDRTNTPITQRLSASGIKVHIGHNEENILGAGLVCYTAAIPADNPELVRARALGIPTMERAELLGEIMKHYKYPIAIAGTHGKTTTTSMLSLILLAASLDPTILVGGELRQIDGNYKIGKEDYLVFEACEYVESFLHFNPYISIITNVEEDHLDYFTDISYIISSFKKFARLNSPEGCIIVCSDDKNALSVVQNIETKVVKYGIISGNNDFYAENIHVNENKKTEFDILYEGKFLTNICLNVHGSHNVLNALAATAAAIKMGIDKKYVKEGLENFLGTKRRFEKLGEVNGAAVIDDYAHHPTEIKSSLTAAREMTDRDIWCIFQPHTYTRTSAFLTDFAEALSLADHTIIADIYPAREKYDGSIHSCDLAALINGGVYINDFGAIQRYILGKAKKGDMIITMGAGDIFKVGEELVRNEK